jgi:hypothetical protein
MDMIFGKLGWDSIPTEPLVLVTMVFMALGAIAVSAVLSSVFSRFCSVVAAWSKSLSSCWEI